MTVTALLWVTLLSIFSFSRALNVSQFAPIDGVGNNIARPTLGSSSNNFFSRRRPQFTQASKTGDGLADALAAIINSNLPNPLDLSYTLSNYTLVPKTKSLHNQLLFAVGILVSQDVALPAFYSQGINIPVPVCHPVFDVLCTGSATFFHHPLEVAQLINGSEYYANKATAFIDASFLYGSNTSQMLVRRSFLGGALSMDFAGLLPTVVSNPYVTLGNLSKQPLFQSGDPRVNVNTFVQTLHTVFAREHNRKASTLATQNPSWDDNTIFYNARKWVIGVWQHIVFDHFLPAISGEALPPYTGYDQTVDPTVPVSFIYMASAPPILSLQNVITLYDAQTFLPSVSLVLSETAYQVKPLKTIPIESVILGMLSTSGNTRSFAFQSQPRQRVASENLNRDALATYIMLSRQIGEASYFDACLGASVDRLATFEQLCQSSALATSLSRLYNQNMTMMDLFVGALLQPYNTFAEIPAIVANEYIEFLTRARNGDRFYYMSPTANYSSTDIDLINQITLEAIIESNSAFSYKSKVSTGSFLTMDVASESVPFSEKLSVPLINQSGTSINFTRDFAVNWAISLAGNESLQATFQMYVNATNFRECWFAIGFGDGLQNSDAYVLSRKNGVLSLIPYWINNGYPTAVKDIDWTLANPIYNFMTLSDDPNYMTVQFSRMVILNSSYGTDITLGVPQSMIWAYSNSEFPAYHNMLRGSFNVTFTTPPLLSAIAKKSNYATNATYNSSICFVYVHAALSIILFMFLIPSAIFMARYMAEKTYWLEIHEKLTTCGLLQFFGLLFRAEPGDFTLVTEGSSHAVMGFTTISMFVFCAGVGYVLRYAQHMLSSHPNVARILRFAHLAVGYLCFGIGQYQCIQGLHFAFGSNFNYPVFLLFYGSWVVAFMTAVAVGEYRIHLIHVMPYNPVAKEQHRVSMKRKYGHLPEFTWQDISNRVFDGSLWLLIDRVVYNVEEFARDHPGGARLLYQAIGSDASSLFDTSMGDVDVLQNSGSSERSEAVYSLTSSAFMIEKKSDGEDRDEEETAKTLIPWFRRNANLHMHSRSAMLALANLAIGTLDISDVNKKGEHPNTKIQKEMFPQITFPGIMPFQSKLVTVVSKKFVSGPDARTTVINLKLAFVTERESAQFFPGDHVVLQYVTSGGYILTRCYTPIKSDARGEMSFLIKMYPDGEFCRVLSHIQEGESLIARGPIPSKGGIYNGNETFGCYNSVGMIVAGTGITPALLLIDHYLRYCPVDQDEALRPQLSLLFVNTSEDDIFFKKELEDLVLDSNGALKVFFCVKEESASWTGYYGFVSESMIRETMPPPNYQPPACSLTGSSSFCPDNGAGGTQFLQEKKNSARRQRGAYFAETEVSLGSKLKTNESGDLAFSGQMSAGQPANTGTVHKADPAFQQTNFGSQTSGSKMGIAEKSKTRLFSTARNSTAKSRRTERRVTDRIAMSDGDAPRFKIMVCGSQKFNTSVTEVLLQMGYNRSVLEIFGGSGGDNYVKISNDINQS